MSTILPHMMWPECEFRMQISAENAKRKNSPSAHHRTTLSGYIFATKACIDSRKKLIKHQYLLHMLSKYGELGQLTVKIGWRVWDTPANFNGFRSLASLFLQLDQQHSTEGATYIWLGGHHVGIGPHSSLVYLPG